MKDDSVGAIPEGEPRQAQPGSELDLVLALAKVAIPLWRAQRRISLEAKDNPQLGVALRYLQMADDQLAEAGVTIRDFGLQHYEAGMSAFIVPIAFNERPECQSPTVIETITPAIFFRNRPVLKSEVIVGVPCRLATATERSHAAGKPVAVNTENEAGRSTAEQAEHRSDMEQPAPSAVGANPEISSKQVSSGTSPISLDSAEKNAEEAWVGSQRQVRSP
jgi:hypothetical protein